MTQVGTLHEEGEKEFQRQREVLEAEVKELREQVRQDAEEIRELTDDLRSTKRKAQLFEERVIVLEESTDAETRSRLEAEQTLDLLKLEVDKLRALVQRQQEEMQQKMKEQQAQCDTELQQVKEELKEAQEQLLHERSGRVLEKQKALDQRLERSAAAGEEKLERLHSLFMQQQHEMQTKAQEQQEQMQLQAKEQQERYDAEMRQLKEDLKAAKQMLQHERNNRMLERETAITETLSASVQCSPVESSPPVPDERAHVSPDRSSERFVTDMQGDLAIFEEVKDLYAEDLFASRRWGGGGVAASNATAAPRPAAQFDAAWLQERQEPINPADNGNISFGPALSAQELSVQEAIERDMEALLRSEALQTLDSLR
ncbi:unnamed protein product [Phytophthora lilii]|uniref:Unnamed protein product n=1 Tax=Phytophthora lilii TaxID=2077276 RepID=A0A9W6XEF5_9STRA|nr:unnamed protein product [Phytophthora lilii]